MNPRTGPAPDRYALGLVAGALLLTLAATPLLGRFEAVLLDAATEWRYRVNSRLLGRVAEFRADTANAAEAGTASKGRALVSGEACLIGIYAPALRHLGRYGSGQWVVRRPYVSLVRAARTTLRPAVIVFDILFQPVLGETVAGAAPAAGGAVGGTVDERVRAALDAGRGDPASDPWLALSELAARASEERLAEEFAEFAAGEGAGLPPLVCACILSSPESNERETWSEADIVGEVGGGDPGRGRAIPYLLDVAIPPANLENLPADLPFSENAKLPSPVLRDYSLLGAINVPRDADGIIRRIPLVLGVRYRHPGDGRPREMVVPSLGLLSVMRYWQVTPDRVRVVFGRWVEITRPDGRCVRAPIDRHGRMLIDFVARPQDFPSVSLAQVLTAGEGTPAEAAVRRVTRGRLALVGLTAAGTTDIGPTSLDPTTPYAYVHLAVINSLLTGRFMRDSGRGLDLALLAAGFALFLLANMGGGLRRLVWTTLAIGALAWAAFLGLFFGHVVALHVLPVTLFLGLGFGALLVYRYVREERARRRIRAMFATMVSPEVLKYMEDNPESFSRTGRRVEATIMFSDISNFTATAERMPPARLTELLNLYFSAMTAPILDSNGYVDKFEGDGIMAEWGVPYPRPDHARAGCLAVLEQARRAAEIGPRLRQDFGFDLHVRFALSSGEVSAGNMGSGEKFQYTVLGDVVNEASRLEPANKDYGTRIIVTERTRREAGEAVEARRLDKVVLAGKTHPVVLYELLGPAGSLSPERRRLVEAYEAGLEACWRRDWDGAEQALRQALALDPSDRPSAVLLERVAGHRLAPPPPDWQGETARTVKG